MSCWNTTSSVDIEGDDSTAPNSALRCLFIFFCTNVSSFDVRSLVEMERCGLPARRPRPQAPRSIVVILFSLIFNYLWYMWFAQGKSGVSVAVICTTACCADTNPLVLLLLFCLIYFKYSHFFTFIIFMHTMTRYLFHTGSRYHSDFIHILTPRASSRHESRKTLLRQVFHIFI